MLDFSGTFDTTNALSAMYLWILFGYLSVLLNCDLQRFIRSHPLAMHLVGILAFFFLFTVLDSQNTSDITVVWVKTILIYIMFILITKSKWYFVVPVMILLLIDQSMKKDLAFHKARLDKDKSKERKDIVDMKEKRVENWSSVINKLIYAIVIIGTAHYVYLQKLEYKKKFSWSAFFLGVSRNCKHTMPDYTKYK
jgi:hypothetical protein